jgi:hypothetical protein
LFVSIGIDNFYYSTIIKTRNKLGTEIDESPKISNKINLFLKEEQFLGITPLEKNIS